MAARDGAPAPRGQLRCASPASGKATPHRCPAPLHPARPGPHDAVPCRHPSPARLVLYDATPPAVGYLCPQDSQVEAPSPGAAVSGAGAKAVEAVRARVCPRGLSPAGRGAPGRQGLCGLPPSAPLPLSLVGNRAPRWPTTATGDGRPSVPPAAAVRRLCCRPWRRRGTRARSRHLHCPRKPGRGQPAPGRRLARCGPLAGPPRWGAAPRPTGGAARGGRGAGAPA